MPIDYYRRWLGIKIYVTISGHIILRDVILSRFDCIQNMAKSALKLYSSCIMCTTK